MHWDVLIIRAKRWLRTDGAGVSYSIVSGITSVLVIGYGEQLSVLKKQRPGFPLVLLF